MSEKGLVNVGGAAISSLSQLEPAARRVLSRQAFDYYAGGADDERTLADNEAAFARLRLLPRVLVDVSRIQLRTELFGCELACPVMVAPMAMHGLAHADGELATARAASAVGMGMVRGNHKGRKMVSTMANYMLRDVAATGASNLFFQLYVLRARGITEHLVREAERGGYKALVVTVDAPRLGKRERDQHNAFALPEGLCLANLDALQKAELLRPVATNGDGGSTSGNGSSGNGSGSGSGSGSSDRSGSSRLDGAGSASLGGSSALERAFAGEMDDSLTWEFIGWLKRITSLPVLVKGVLHPDDARLAVEHGADGVVVSNHGGRQVDTAVSSIDALPGVVAAVGRRVPVLVDGGVRRGSDVYKCLALGASVVLLGRPCLYALALGGQQGVEAALRLLQRELILTMALMGTPTLASLRQPGLVVTIDTNGGGVRSRL